MAHETICKECQHCTFLSYNMGGDIMVHCFRDGSDDVICEELKDCDYFTLPEYNTDCFDEFGAFKPEYLPELRSQICLGSVYFDDYRNEYGINPKFLSNFFEDYLDWLDERGLPDSDNNLMDWYEETSYEITVEDLTTKNSIKSKYCRNYKSM